MALTPTQTATLNQASASAVETIWRQIGRFVANGRWLQENNRYPRYTIDRIKADVTAGTVNHAWLSAYIVASSPLHCMDGWGLLGRALAAHSAGDRHAAVHFGYYAELRAAMSLLASAGIGVFSKQHFVIRDDRSCRLVPGTPSTHGFAWDALDAWAARQDAGDLVGRVIAPGGQALSEWLTNPALPMPWRPLGADWLRSWGADLQYFGPDQTARNESSYRPSGFRTLVPMPSAGTRDLLTETWRLLEPSAYGTPETVDRVLLHGAVRYAHAQLVAAGFTQTLRQYVLSLVGAVGLAGPAGASWVAFLSRPLPRTQRLATIARLGAQSRSRIAHFGVIARATLLLRLATGIARERMHQAGIVRSDASFWWNPLGQQLGLWEVAAPPTTFVDLWPDVEEAIDQAELGTPTSMVDWLGSVGDAAVILGQGERSGLWSLLG